MTILVTGTIDIDPDQRDAFVDAARTLMSATRAEDGCEHYAFSADVDDPGRFHLSERWADEESLAAHGKAPHFAAFMGAVGGMARGGSATRWDGATGSKLM